MSNFWKYLLIFLGVLVLVFIVALPLFAMGFSMMNGTGMMRGFGINGFRQMPMFNFGMHGFGGMGGFGAFRIFGLLLRCLVPLAVIGLVVAGIIALARRPSQPVPPAAPIVPAAPAPVQPVAVETRTCPNCGRVVEAGWVACPYCGAPLNEPTRPPEPPATPPEL